MKKIPKFHMGNETQYKPTIKHALNLQSHCILLQTTLNFQTFHHIVEFKKLSELATLIDIRNPFFTRKIKKLLELKTCNFWLKVRNF